MAHRRFSSKERRGLLLLLAMAIAILLIRMLIFQYSDESDKKHEWKPFVPVATNPVNVTGDTSSAVTSSSGKSSKKKSRKQKSNRKNKTGEKKSIPSSPPRDLLRDTIATRH